MIGGGTVRLGGLNTFTSGVEIDDGTLELGSSSVGWGGQSPTFYQVQTQDGAGDALTLDVYLAKISNGASSGYEVTVYNAADEAIGGGFPFSSSALGSDDFYLELLGQTRRFALDVVDDERGAQFLASIGIDDDLANQGTDLSTSSTIELGGFLSTAAEAASSSSSSIDIAATPISTAFEWTNGQGASAEIAVYFTNTGANAWGVAVYDASTAAPSGGAPYASGALGTATLTFNASGQIVNTTPLSFTIDGHNLSLSFANISLTTTTQSYVAPIEANLGFQPIAGDEDLGPLPSADIGAGFAAGAGVIKFGDVAGDTETLQVDSGAPASTIVGFEAGDVIKLAGVNISTERLSSNAAGRLLIPYGGDDLTLTFGDDLPAQSLFQLTADAGGGVSITLLQDDFVANSNDDFAVALRDIAPGGADAAAAGVYSIDLNNIASASGQAIGMDASAQLTLEGSASVTGSGLLFQSGDTLLDGATLSSANAQQSFAVEAAPSSR